MPQFSLSGILKKEITIGTETIQVDGITEVNAINSRAITQHPTERGYNVSDAQHQLPIMVTLRAWITNNGQRVGDRRSFLSLPNITGLQLIESNVQNQLAKLEEQANEGGLVTATTKNATYTEYYCLSFEHTENEDSGVLITMSLMENQTTETERDTINFNSDIIGIWS